MTTTEPGVQVLITGRVQGVGFRYFARAAAKAHRIRGFVRNLPDGRVEVVAIGACVALEKLIKTLKKGPPASSVQKCLIEWVNDPGHFADFTIRQ